MELTVSDLRRRLIGADDRAVVGICVEGFPYAPVTHAKFDAPTEGERREGSIGVFILMPDPASEMADMREPVEF